MDKHITVRKNIIYCLGDGDKKKKNKYRNLFIVGIQEISNGRTHVSLTPKKPEYPIARSQLTGHGVRWDSVPFNFDGW